MAENDLDSEPESVVMPRGASPRGTTSDEQANVGDRRLREEVTEDGPATTVAVDGVLVPPGIEGDTHAAPVVEREQTVRQALLARVQMTGTEYSRLQRRRKICQLVGFKLRFQRARNGAKFWFIRVGYVWNTAHFIKVVQHLECQITSPTRDPPIRIWRYQFAIRWVGEATDLEVTILAWKLFFDRVHAVRDEDTAGERTTLASAWNDDQIERLSAPIETADVEQLVIGEDGEFYTGLHDMYIDRDFHVYHVP